LLTCVSCKDARYSGQNVQGGLEKHKEPLERDRKIIELFGDVSLVSLMQHSQVQRDNKNTTVTYHLEVALQLKGNIWSPKL
jgi:hypothetical protein